MEKYIIFGAGNFGFKAIDLVGKKNIVFFVDNDPEKQKADFYGFSIYSLEEALLQKKKYMIMIAVSTPYIEEIEKQLQDCGIQDYITIQEFQVQITRKKLEQRRDYIAIYNRAIRWIENHTIVGEGIINNTNLKKSYPEVSGYYIPTLIRWGYRDLAVSYAKWLCDIQKDDGSWYDTYDQDPYIFDSAQILKGLIAIREIYPRVNEHILKGADWILSKMTDEGRLVAPTKEAWGDENTCSELIHMYCLSPLVEAAQIFGIKEYEEKAYKILHYYISHYREDILNFSLLSHFYAYVIEAMIDMGEMNLAKEAMANMEMRQKQGGAVPAYNNVDWVCSTGLFQLALIWFRLGNLECGNRAFNYACTLQNESGGWYGSYLSEENPREMNTYFPDGEISWAVKYFLDALYYKNLAQFNEQAGTFLSEFRGSSDGRYRIVKNEIMFIGSKNLKVLDVGCGKGRYLRRLAIDLPDNSYYAIDLSLAVMEYFDIEQVEKSQGSLTNISYPDNYFDVIYTCEALEHAVDISSAIREMARVTKNCGKIIVIDKNKEKLGMLEIEEWEQWFDDKELQEIMSSYCSETKVKKDISYDNEESNGLFYAWIGMVKKE